MKRSFFIFLSLILYVILCSKSCDSDTRNAEKMRKDSIAQITALIRAELGANTLSEASLHAYEVKAQQKLIDFADYLSIYRNQNLDQPMREQARYMILTLFESGDVRFQPAFSNSGGSGNLTLTEFLGQTYPAGNNSTKIIIDSIWVGEPLRQTGPKNYRGNLIFSRQVKTCSPSDTLVSAWVKMKVDISAAKVKKSIGIDTLQVWSILLGDIN